MHYMSGGEHRLTIVASELASIWRPIVFLMRAQNRPVHAVKMPRALPLECAEDRIQIPTRHCEDYKPVMFDLSQTLFLSTLGR